MRFVTIALCLTLAIPAFAQSPAEHSVFLADQEAKLASTDLGPRDDFGYSVAISGDRAIVGARADDGVSGGTGSAYIFVRSGGTWAQEAKLVASDADTNDEFGTVVAIDGDIALVGVHKDESGTTQTGSVYVFARSGSTWTQEAKLRSSRDNSFAFGFDVAIQGDTALIGAEGDRDAGLATGAAYVFTRDGGTWTQETILVADDAAEFQQFGHAVSLSGDRALIGAPFGFSSTNRNGTAYVFVRSGSTWTQEARLIPNESPSRPAFGVSVSLSGTRALVGASKDSEQGTSSGSAYIFAKSGDSWSQEAQLLPADVSTEHSFGRAVALSADGALVGAPGGGTTFSGEAYAFTRASGAWEIQDTFTSTDIQARDFFGWSVALDGTQAIIGAYGDDDAGAQSGAAYVFSNVVPVDSETDVPTGVTLSAPAPNPASGETALTLTVERAQHVRAVVYDALGREVATAFDGPVVSAASLRIQTHRLPAGVYAVRVWGETFSLTRSLTVVR